MKAYLKNYRQSPRKVRLVADLIKGKRVSDALIELAYLPKRSAGSFATLLQSAVANAVTNFAMAKENLVVSDVRVDKGVTLKRSMPRARGSASRINKRSSHITLTLKMLEVTKTKPKKVTA